MRNGNRKKKFRQQLKLWKLNQQKMTTVKQKQTIRIAVKLQRKKARIKIQMRART